MANWTKEDDKIYKILGWLLDESNKSCAYRSYDLGITIVFFVGVSSVKNIRWVAISSLVKNLSTQ